MRKQPNDQTGWSAPGGGGRAATARRGRPAREAKPADRPDRLLVDERDRPRIHEPRRLGPDRHAHPSDRLTIDVGNDPRCGRGALDLPLQALAAVEALGLLDGVLAAPRLAE